MHSRKKLQIGSSDFKDIIDNNGYFVDKTLLIQEIIDSGYKVLVIPRPRRFGKSLNLSMLKYYFDIEEKDNAKLFESYKIGQAGAYYTTQAGKYPVIFLSLKAAKATSYQDAVLYLKHILKEVHELHRYVLEKNILSPQETVDFEKILAGEADLSTYLFSIQKLSKYLHQYHNQKVLILMDEYDAPIHAGFYHGFYEEIISLMKSLMGNTFKDNTYLYKGIITGILRIARESIFSDLNNPGIFSILSTDFDDKFGFTTEEVKELIAYYGFSNQYEKIKDWYDGYTFGQVAHIYNPWSIVNYISRQADGFKPYWVNTSSDNLIKSRLIEKEAHQMREVLEKLILGETINKTVNENIVFSDFDEDKEILWSLLVFCGYLSPIKQVDLDEYELKIPNYEIKMLFKRIIIEWFKKELKIGQTTLKAMVKSLTNNSIKDFEKYFKQIMGDTFSYFDVNTEPERVYQAYILGLLGVMSDDYIIKSNKESGLGRYDILLLPRKQHQYGILMEIKQLPKRATKKRINSEIAKALKQITDNKYYKELEVHKIQNRIEMAIVFAGQEVYLDVNP